jgi:hypothetical protein
MPVIADEVVPLGLADESAPLVYPSMRDVLLNDDVADRLNIHNDARTLARTGLARWYADALQGCDLQREVFAICLLSTHAGSEVRFQEVMGHEKMFAILQLDLGRQLPDVQTRHFAKLGRALCNVRVVRIHRPDRQWSLPQVMESLQRMIAA